MPRRTWLPVLPVLLVLGLTSTPAAIAEPRRGGTSATASSTYALTTVQFENRLLSRVNTRRAKVGCPALRLNSSLVRSSRAHSMKMAAAEDMSHQLPGEAFFSTRITRAGYTGWRKLAENIAFGYPSPGAIFSVWMGSAPHRANIQDCYLREFGAGVSYNGGDAWVTMDFGRR